METMNNTMKMMDINEVMANGQHRYAILEQGIPYDWDDYGAFGAVVFDRVNRVIDTYCYGHGCNIDRPCGYLPEEKNDIILALANYKMVLGNIIEKYPFTHHMMIGGGVFDGEEVLVLGYFNEQFSKEGFDKSVGLPEYYIVYNERTNQYTEATEEEMVGYGYCRRDSDYAKVANGRLLKVYGTDGFNENIGSLIHQVAYSMSYCSSDRDMAHYCAKKIAQFVNEKLNLSDNLQKIIANAKCMREEIKREINIKRQAVADKAESKRQKQLEKVTKDLMDWAKKVEPQGSQEEWNNLVQRVLWKRYPQLVK